MWCEEPRAFLVPMDGGAELTACESLLTRRGFIELPTFPSASPGSRALQSIPRLVGRQTPCLHWALGNSLSCPRALFELTTWSQTHTMPYPVPALAHTHSVGIRLRCLDRHKRTRLCTRRSPPVNGSTTSAACSSSVFSKPSTSRPLEEGEHVWLEHGDRLVVCDTLVMELVVLRVVRLSPPVAPPETTGAPVQCTVSTEHGSGVIRVALPAVTWAQLSQRTRVRLVAKAAVHARCARMETRAGHTKSSSSRAEEELVHTAGPSSQMDLAPRGEVSAQAVEDEQEDEDRGAATPSKQESQLPPVTHTPPMAALADTATTRIAETDRPRAGVSPRPKSRRTESGVASTPTTSEANPLETLEAQQLRSRSSQVAASVNTETPANGAPDSCTSLGSRSNSGSTVLAKNSYLETFDEHLNEALLQLENKSAEMNANWLQQTSALLGAPVGAGTGGGAELLGEDAPRAASPSANAVTAPATAARSRTSPKSSAPRSGAKSKSTTPRRGSRRARRSGDRARTLSSEVKKPIPSVTGDVPFHGAAESQEVFFQH